MGRPNYEPRDQLNDRRESSQHEQVTDQRQPLRMKNTRNEIYNSEEFNN